MSYLGPDYGKILPLFLELVQSMILQSQTFPSICVSLFDKPISNKLYNTNMLN